MRKTCLKCKYISNNMSYCRKDQWDLRENPNAQKSVAQHCKYYKIEGSDE